MVRALDVLGGREVVISGPFPSGQLIGCCRSIIIVPRRRHDMFGRVEVVICSRREDVKADFDIAPHTLGYAPCAANLLSVLPVRRIVYQEGAKSLARKYFHVNPQNRQDAMLPYAVFVKLVHTSIAWQSHCVWQCLSSQQWAQSVMSTEGRRCPTRSRYVEERKCYLRYWERM